MPTTWLVEVDVVASTGNFDEVCAGKASRHLVCMFWRHCSVFAEYDQCGQRMVRHWFQQSLAAISRSDSTMTSMSKGAIARRVSYRVRGSGVSLRGRLGDDESVDQIWAFRSDKHGSVAAEGVADQDDRAGVEGLDQGDGILDVGGPRHVVWSTSALSVAALVGDNPMCGREPFRGGRPLTRPAR